MDSANDHDLSNGQGRCISSPRPGYTARSKKTVQSAGRRERSDQKNAGNNRALEAVPYLCLSVFVEMERPEIKLQFSKSQFSNLKLKNCDLSIVHLYYHPIP